MSKEIFPIKLEEGDSLHEARKHNADYLETLIWRFAKDSDVIKVSDLEEYCAKLRSGNME